MKLRLPASFQDLTLRHLMTLETETDPVKRVQAVTGHSFAELRKMPHKLIVEANAHLDTLQANEVAQHKEIIELNGVEYGFCLLYTSPSPRDRTRSRMPSSA